jgi:hypothetical protein
MKTLADPAAGERLIARLERVTSEARRRWGTLTSAEMLCHLGDVARSVLGGGKPHPLKARPRPVMKWIALYSPIPWPKGRIRTPPGVDPRDRGTRPGEFERDRAGAIEGVRRLAAAPPEAFPATHFIFGVMRADDWRRWGYLHTDYHLRQFGL